MKEDGWFVVWITGIKDIVVLLGRNNGPIYTLIYKKL